MIFLSYSFSEVICRSVILPPDKVWRKYPDSASSTPGLALQSLEMFVETWSHHHLIALPGAPL